MTPAIMHQLRDVVCRGNYAIKLEKLLFNPDNAGIVVIPANRKRFGRRFDSAHLHHSKFIFTIWGCTGFDGAKEG